MSKKAWLMIVGLGVGSVVVLGLLMGYVVDSNPALKAAIAFKQSLAEDFSSRGVEEVSLRYMKKERGYWLSLVATLPADEEGRERLDAEVADYFVRRHKDKQARLLKISYVPPSSWGCRAAAADAQRQKEVRLAPLRKDIARRERQVELASDLERKLGCKLLSARIEGDELYVRVGVVTARSAAEMRNLPQSIETTVRARMRGLYTSLKLSLLEGDGTGSDGTAKVLFDGKFSRRGRRIERLGPARR